MITMLHDVDLATMEVCVYKNLNDGSWSITAVKGNDNRGLLLARADHLVLIGARAVVKESRRVAICNGGHREVCAWFIGKIDTAVVGPCGMDQIKQERVTFHPRERASFFVESTGEPVHDARCLYFSAEGNAYLV